MRLEVEHAGLTHPGLVRPENEDNWSADPEQGLYIVSDGVGGQFAGSLASRIVAETLPVLLRQHMSGVEDLSIPEAPRRIAAALSELSAEVYEQTHGEPGLEGMGATVVMALVRDSTVLVAHMGDSRVYLFRGGDLTQLTKDHSLVQLLIDSGDITPEEAASHPSRGRVTRSVGMPGEPLPEVSLVELRDGDRLVLCTDGLTGMISDDEIRATLKQNSSVKAACEGLIQAALDAGGKDNVTAVVLRVRSAAEASRRRASVDQPGWKEYRG